MKAYIIIGVAGDYSDRTEWLVKGYLNEVHAKQECERIDARSREVQSQLGDSQWDFNWYDNDDAKVKEIRAFVGDAYFRYVLSDPPRYHVKEVDIVDLGWTTFPT